MQSLTRIVKRKSKVRFFRIQTNILLYFIITFLSYSYYSRYCKSFFCSISDVKSKIRVKITQSKGARKGSRGKLVEHWPSYDLRGTFCLSTMANLLLLRDVLVVYRGFCMFYIIKPYFACRWCLLTDGRFYKRAFPLLSWPRYVQMYDDYNFRVKWIFFFFFVNRVLIILISVLFRIIFAEYLCFHFLNKNFLTLTFFGNLNIILDSSMIWTKFHFFISWNYDFLK